MPVTGGTCQLDATITPAGANTDTAITWTSSATGVATVSNSGLVTAVSAGDATITATTANGKSDTFAVKVQKDVTGLSYNTPKQPSGPMAYEMKRGDTVKLAAPMITPEDAYGALTYESSSPSFARITFDETDGYLIEGLAAGSSVITATSHNGKTAQFTMTVKPPLTNATLPGNHTMDVNTTWTPTVTLTPNTGAYVNYVLSAGDSDVVRIEKNSEVYAIKPGTAKITVSIDGNEKSICTVTVSPPAQSVTGSPGLKYYNVTYESNGMATASLGIVPVAGATYYIVTEHVAYYDGISMVNLFAASNIKEDGSGQRIWFVEAADAASPLDFDGTETGLRFFSVVAYSSPVADFDPYDLFAGNQIGNVFVGRVPVLYYPRNFGGTSSSNTDGYVAAIPFGMYIVTSLYGGYFYLMPVPPFAVGLTFDKIPGAAGYDFFCTSNGKNWGDDNKPQPAGNRVISETGSVLEEGETIFNVKPYVYDINGDKLYGEMRTVIFKLGAVPLEGGRYWENSSTLNSPIMVVVF